MSVTIEEIWVCENCEGNGNCPECGGTGEIDDDE